MLWGEEHKETVTERPIILSQGQLIAVEGIDGAGKTTQVDRLAETYRACGFEVVTAKEPTNGRWGRVLRESAKNGRLRPEEEAETFIKDRRQAHPPLDPAEGTEPVAARGQNPSRGRLNPARKK